MDCKNVRALYTLFRDGSLEPLPAKEVSEHIHACQECRQLYDSLDRITKVAGTIKEVKPNEQVIDRVLERIKAIPASRWFLDRRWVFAYTIVILFVAGFSFGLIRRISIQKKLIAQKQEEQLIKREGKYIMDYGQFEKGRVIYSVPGAGNTIQVVETSY